MKDSATLEVEANIYAGQQLRRLRGKMTRAKFSKIIGMSEGMIFEYENNKAKIPLGRITAIAAILSVPIETFTMPSQNEDAKDQYVA